MQKSKEKLAQEFELLARPLIKYLAENHHPHVAILIDNTHAELLEGQMSFSTEEYLVD